MSSNHHNSAGSSSHTQRHDESPRHRDRAVQTDAIGEYRDRALSTRSPRANTLRIQLERPRTRESDDDRPHTSSRSHHDEPDQADQDTSLMVRHFLEENDENRDNRNEISEGETFFPTPKITFLIDKPGRLICQICMEASLEMGVSSHDHSSTSLSILPCGHVACLGCMENWIRVHKKCPFCRDPLRRACGHVVKPVPIACDTIQELPLTVPRGGIVSETCSRCAKKKIREKALDHFRRLSRQFLDVRRKFQASSGNVAGDIAEQMKSVEASLESYSVKLTLDDMYKRKGEW